MTYFTSRRMFCRLAGEIEENNETLYHYSRPNQVYSKYRDKLPTYPGYDDGCVHIRASHDSNSPRCDGGGSA